MSMIPEARAPATAMTEIPAEKEEPQEQNRQRNQGQIGSHFGDVLNALQTHERSAGGPDDAERDIQPGRIESSCQRIGRAEGVDAQPAELEQTHQETGHEE